MAKSAKVVSVAAQDLQNARLDLLDMKRHIRQLVSIVTMEKMVASNTKACAAQDRIDAAVAKAQEKLNKALARTVKSPTQKKRASRRAGAVTVIGAEENAIAARFAANKLQKELF